MVAKSNCALIITMFIADEKSLVSITFIIIDSTTGIYQWTK